MKKLQIFKLSVFYFLIFICSCEKNEYQPSETETETFTDSRDGQTYKTVQIGTQIWMAENLNYKTSFGSWATSYTTIYGRLYDWETANDVCPSGWHLPSDNEWRQLEMAISQSDADEYTNAGTKLKATSGWYNNGNGTDDYGFEALPVGCRNNDGDLTIDGWAANFWSSTANDSGWAWAWGLHYFNEELHRFINNKDYGYSVRCVKD